MKALLGLGAAGAMLAVFLLLHGAGHGSSPFAVAVARAATKCPDGFSSVSAHGLPAGADPTATLSDSCALSFGIPAGAKGDAGATGAPGAPGAAGPPGVTNFGPVGAVTVKSTKSNSSYRVVTEATARCPSGEKALGGGYAISVTVDGAPARQTAAVRAVNLNSSKSNAYKNEPTGDGTGWTVGVVTVVTPARIGPGHTHFSHVILKVTANCAKVGA